MIKINTPSTVGSVKTLGIKKNKNPSFEISQNTIVNENLASTSLSTIDALSHLMDLQEIALDTDSQHRHFKEQGEFLLNTLDNLRMDLLNGTLSPNQLEQLAKGLQRRQYALDESQLSHVIKEIEQRVAIELAKLEVAQNSKKILSDVRESSTYNI